MKKTDTLIAAVNGVDVKGVVGENMTVLVHLTMKYFEQIQGCINSLCRL